MYLIKCKSHYICSFLSKQWSTLNQILSEHATVRWRKNWNSLHGNSAKHSLGLDLHDPIPFYSHLKHNYQPVIKHLYDIDGYRGSVKSYKKVNILTPQVAHRQPLFFSLGLPQDFFPLTHPTDALSLFPASSKLPREEITAERKPPESDFVFNRDSKILVVSKPDLIKYQGKPRRLSWRDMALVSVEFCWRINRYEVGKPALWGAQIRACGEKLWANITSCMKFSPLSLILQSA